MAVTRLWKAKRAIALFDALRQRKCIFTRVIAILKIHGHLLRKNNAIFTVVPYRSFLIITRLEL
jgi:hypothetical protein